MSEIEAEALRLIEDNKIKEGIKKYEELQLKGKIDEQLNKLQVANQIVQAGKVMQDETINDILVLVEKIKTQIGFYDIGGSEYRQKKRQGLWQLVSIYQTLCNNYGDSYNNELGKWMVEYAEYSNEYSEYLDLIKKAAYLPSYEGLFALGRACEYRSVTDPVLDAKAREFYNMAIKLKEAVDSVCTAEQRLEMLPDFSLNQAGTEIFYRILSEKDHTVSICSKNLMIHNAPCGYFEIPSYVRYNGVKYKVTSIDPYAFYHNRLLTGVTIPKTIQSIGEKAFEGTSISKLICKSTIDISNIKIYLNENVSDKKNKQNTETDIKAIDDVKLFLQKKIDLIQHVCRIEMAMNYDKNATSFPEYEELLSIGIIALQVMINNDPNIMNSNKCTDSYLASTIKWAIDSELQQRYDWYKLLAQNYSFLYNAAEYIDYKSAFVSVFILQTQYEIYQAIQQGIIKDAFYPNILEMGKLVDEFVCNYSNSDGKYLKSIIVDRMMPVEAAETFGISLEDLFNALTEASSKFCKTAHDKNLKENYFYFEKDKSKDLPEGYITKFNFLNSLSANSVYDFHKKLDLIELDINECISIGLICCKVLCNNKTKEQIDSLSDIYVMTGISWAIENELKIRYGSQYKNSSIEIDSLTISVDGVDMKKLAANIGIIKNVSRLSQIVDNSDYNKLSSRLPQEWYTDTKMVIESIHTFLEDLKSHINTINDKQERQIMEKLFIKGKLLQDVLKENYITYDNAIVILNNHVTNFIESLSGIKQRK